MYLGVTEISVGGDRASVTSAAGVAVEFNGIYPVVENCVGVALCVVAIRRTYISSR